jgi:hypothetical protein
MRNRTKQLIVILLSLAIFALAIIAVIILISSNKNSTEYVTEYPLSAHEYSITVNEKLVTVMNILETHMSSGRAVINGEYPSSDELASVNQSIATVKETADYIDGLYPARGYEDEKHDISRKINNAINSLETYRDALLKDDHERIKSVIEIMSGDFIAIKGSYAG